MEHIRVRVNGRDEVVSAHPQTTLLLALRNDLGLKGVRAGCGVGACGSCAVLVDGKLEKSCSVSLDAVEGRSVTTPEGLLDGATLHPVQESFLARQAGQCGWCINGFIMGAVAAQQRDDQPTESGCPEWLDEHICRCGTHVRIVDAVAGRHESDVAGAVDEGGIGDTRRLAVAGALVDTTDRSVGERDVLRTETWLRLTPAGRVEVLTGKVELGQGIRAALAQIAASQLGVPLGLVDVLSAGTQQAPNEMYTAGSMSVEDSGTAIGRAAVAFRRHLLERACTHLRCSPTELQVEADGVDGPSGRRVTFAELAADGPIQGQILDDDQPDWTAAPIGESVPRGDLVGKLTGAPSYLHDLELPGMLHARALLPPTADAKLVTLDTDSVIGMEGVIDVLHDGRLVVVIADREDVCGRALERLRQQARWDQPGLTATTNDLFEALAELPRHDREDGVCIGTPLTTADGPVQATYQQPYHAHASIAPSAAIAAFDDGRWTVWTHSQGIYPLRESLAALLDVDRECLRLSHLDGPGCYGHNLADDAAAFAALAARAVPRRPVRFMFSSEDELTWEPYGTAMQVDLAAALDDHGHVESWRHAVITDTHNTRPDGSADRLVPSWLMADGKPLQWPGAGFGFGGSRNTAPLYDFPSVEAFAEHVQGPLRVSALRTLGAFANTFAAESFMDELAERAGMDPLAFRLAHLTDIRAAHVLQRAAELADWEPHVGPSGRGVGLAVSQYKNAKAYVALAVHASIDPYEATVRIHHVDVVCDAGVAVNPDGLRNQIEGGIIQGFSRALYEQVGFDRTGITTRDWLTYTVMPLSATPSMRVELVETIEHPPLGTGEASVGPAAAALANAIDDASGVRLRRLPFTPDSVRDQLLNMSEGDAARVST